MALIMNPQNLKQKSGISSTIKMVQTMVNVTIMIQALNLRQEISNQVLAIIIQMHDFPWVI